MSYIGSSPTKVVSRQSANIFTYTATANQTAFTGADTDGNTLACTPSDIMVHMNGLRLEESDYTASTTTVTLGSGAAAGDEITITAFLTFESADHYTKSAADTRYANVSGDTFTGNVTFADGADIITATAGTDNVRLGENAGDSIASGGNYNVAIGKDAGTSLTTGDSNVAVGIDALYGTTTSNHNVAIGKGSLASNVTGEKNIAIGSASLDANTTGDQNVAVGNSALGSMNITDGSASYNTAVGADAGKQITTGTGNTFFGALSGNAITTGSSHSILGKFSGNDNNLDIRTSTEPHIVLSAGDGRPAMFFDENQGSFGTWYAGNYANNMYWPIVGTSNGKNAISQNLSAGQLGVTTDSTAALYINRNNTDGYLVLFYSEGTLEGNISVSGSTVSYNGGHLARWSQLSDGSKDASILKGTVMTNLDKMCVWKHAAVAEGDKIKSASGDERIATKDDVADAYTEDNEQLNCMAVSSVEGDPNVAGVFVNWDTADDGYNDMNIAMTGDMVIRIAKGVTVARGDLLMSAGDGTAKPQDDDIVRSKTIAKVTSTNVSHTYDDGSFLVPCVLMAC